MYASIQSRITTVNKPSLLIKGEYDPITCDVKIEEPERYADVVTQFIYSSQVI
ncbi:hypothetical protein GK047_06785 [Paenibacillus sp. SYP-B3998]|uniref:Alpha/beta hydrolase n=1 Tax=Paenibacillus sp. SYP-B3998 TaxID=2678564 RepID=A0A6G3ZUD1_9BACL|nr:hypothetical protein [Paenibacillus sp. SYP-B3998]NEW05725.1 hypothetical protein [Paenibacillus sp. SYP-B3998]